MRHSTDFNINLSILPMLSFFIARRYLFAKKSHNVINLISLVSAIGVGVGTFALVVALSVYNGLDSLVKSLYSTLSPDLRITAVEGKTINPLNDTLQQLRHIPGVAYYSEYAEENALLQYNGKQHLATIRGVDSVFVQRSGIALQIIDGAPTLQQGDVPMAIVGKVVALTLNLRPQFLDLLWVYFPRRGHAISLDPSAAFNKGYLRPSGVFSIEMESDSKYVFVPLAFAQSLLQYQQRVSGVELYLAPEANIKSVQRSVQQTLGSGYVVKNKAQQNEMLYRMMQSEKWAIFLILSFVLLIASFNSVGSLTMLIIEKKKDIRTLHALGATEGLIRRIFVREGLMISMLGCAVGAVLGLLACWVQIHFGILTLQGNFVVNAYPVEVQWQDVVLVVVAVMAIGYLAASIPVRFILKK